jgi:hypothetical protein
MLSRLIGNSSTVGNELASHGTHRQGHYSGIAGRQFFAPRRRSLEFRDAHLGAERSGFLVDQDQCCVATDVPLQGDGQDDDAFLASLDRIDNYGDYSPGNREWSVSSSIVENPSRAILRLGDLYAASRRVHQ